MLDIETSFLISGHWSIWNQNIGINQIFEGGRVICYAAKWAGETPIVWRHDGNADFLTTIHALLDAADVIMTYNGKKFDLPMLNREFVKAGLSPPAPYKHIDLLETVKKQFKFPSNKLDYVCRELKVGEKLSHEGFSLWVKCAEGDLDSWNTMREYNIQDVIILENLYGVLRPWVIGHPNAALYTGTNGHQCSTCGSDRLQKRGFHVTGVGRYQRYSCNSCGGWSRSRVSDVTKEARKVLLAPL